MSRQSCSKMSQPRHPFRDRSEPIGSGCPRLCRDTPASWIFSRVSLTPRVNLFAPVMHPSPSRTPSRHALMHEQRTGRAFLGKVSWPTTGEDIAEIHDSDAEGREFYRGRGRLWL